MIGIFIDLETWQEIHENAKIFIEEEKKYINICNNLSESGLTEQESVDMLFSDKDSSEVRERMKKAKYDMLNAILKTSK